MHFVRWDKKHLLVPYGSVVATATLAEALQVVSVFDGQVWTAHMGPASNEHRSKAIKTDPHGDFSLGRWLWMLQDIERVDPPVPARGFQGWWEWTPLRPNAISKKEHAQ